MNKVRKNFISQPAGKENLEHKYAPLHPIETVTSIAPLEPQKRRYTIDLTGAAVGEIEKIKEIFSLSAADIFRFALVLIRIYVEARLEKKKIQIVDPNDPQATETIVLPFFAPAAEHFSDKNGEGVISNEKLSLDRNL